MHSSKYVDALYLAHRSKLMKEFDPSDLLSREMKRIRNEVTAITKSDRSPQAEVRGILGNGLHGDDK